jgi:hypothetical protein
VPLKGWFPYLSLGNAQFSHYQSLPHLLTAYISLIFGSDSTERWAGYLLFALFPIGVYAGSRLLGWSNWAAGGAALLSPLLVSVTGYGYESFSYTWLGNGLWSTSIAGCEDSASMTSGGCASTPPAWSSPARSS